eukprot:CAMPEP_0197928078 /NCGR_PEP_ID=MMETSP1439-20131203/101730_1 /TAXON_ID=66791 /ORGANISM="Gonyaulax spinifera, Strain CCMP409" /LENGTH=236 /DNA_ID=CAMNT_0043550669 /DNA_START=349 /DNA_END=1056 /DNA_ORIENTATION=+
MAGILAGVAAGTASATGLATGYAPNVAESGSHSPVVAKARSLHELAATRMGTCVTHLLTGVAAGKHCATGPVADGRLCAADHRRLDTRGSAGTLQWFTQDDAARRALTQMAELLACVRSAPKRFATCAQTQVGLVSTAALCRTADGITPVPATRLQGAAGLSTEQLWPRCTGDVALGPRATTGPLHGLLAGPAGTIMARLRATVATGAVCRVTPATAERNWVCAETPLAHPPRQVS